MTSISTESSFEEIENAYSASFDTEKPKKPQQSPSASSADVRLYADKLEAYEVKMSEHKTARALFDENKEKIYQVWRQKIKQEYMPKYQQQLFNLVLEQAERNVGRDLRCVREALDELIDYTDSVINMTSGLMR